MLLVHAMTFRVYLNVFSIRGPATVLRRVAAPAWVRVRSQAGGTPTTLPPDGQIRSLPSLSSLKRISLH